MKKLFYLSVALCAITCVATVFNGCSDITENQLRTTPTAELTAIRAPQNKIPKSLWVSLAKAQDDANNFYSKMDKMSTEERSASVDQDIKYTLQVSSALSKVLKAFDEAYEDSSCTDDDFPIEDTTYYKSPEQMTLAYVKKHHTEAFYNIAKNLLDDDAFTIKPYEVANSDELSDEEKLKLMYIYIVESIYEDNDSTDYGDNKECYKNYEKDMKRCSSNFKMVVLGLRLIPKDERAKILNEAREYRKECEDRAFEVLKMCTGTK